MSLELPTKLREIFQEARDSSFREAVAKREEWRVAVAPGISRDDEARRGSTGHWNGEFWSRYRFHRPHRV